VTEQPPGRDDGGGETEKQRLDRNLTELLGELRVALPGVQVLFAFLLTVPFSQQFSKVTPFQEKVYFVTLLLTAVASALLIAPTAHHRIEFRLKDKRHIVATANVMAIAGLAALALAMVGAVLLITDFLFGPATTIAVSTTAFLLFATVWYAMPISRRMRRGHERDEPR
jgi:hypothetical protein